MSQEDTKSLISRNFTHITIPAEIWLRKDISIQAKALWAEIRSLHDKSKGGCWASDDYLQEFMGLKRSRLHEVLKELKDIGLVVDVSFDGRDKVRKAIVPDVEYDEVAGHQLSGIPDSCYPENRIPATRDPGSSHIYREKEKNKETHKEKDSVCVEFGSYVKMKKEEYDRLVEEHKEPLIKEIIQQMNDYCESTRIKGYASYSAAIRQWINRRKAMPLTPIGFKTNTVDRRTKNRDGSPVNSPVDGLF